MNKLIKFIIKLCFCIWLITSILPDNIPTDNKIVSVLFQAGKYQNIALFILAIIAFAIPMFSKKKLATAGKKGNKLILHDLDIETAESLFKDVSDAKIFCAAKKMSKCTGCFGCWLRTPALCVIRDGTESLGEKIAHCDEFIIISRNLYGGFSKEIKNALDRSISFALPFFDVRNGEIHHQMRYPKIGTIKTYIYNSGGISDTDKATLMEITKANSINFNKIDYQTIFVHDVNELKEVLT